SAPPAAAAVPTALPEPADAAAPGDLVGRYLLRSQLPVEVAAADGGLTLVVPGQRPATLIPLAGYLRYHLPGLDCDITFRRENGRFDIMELKQAGNTEIATRTS
ncbi:MAG: hypothetical protein ACRDUA_05090, partial [Micromonosporaceae bacterium]